MKDRSFWEPCPDVLCGGFGDWDQDLNGVQSSPALCVKTGGDIAEPSGISFNCPFGPGDGCSQFLVDIRKVLVI